MSTMDGGSGVTAEIGTVSDEIESIATKSDGPPTFDVNKLLRSIGEEPVEADENTNY